MNESFKRLLPLLLLFTLPDAITGYVGSGGAVSFLHTNTGLPVTSIGRSASWNYCSPSSVAMPNRLASLG